eukprot:354643-Chlamydomonas_euryale.AAC.2
MGGLDVMGRWKDRWLDGAYIGEWTDGWVDGCMARRAGGSLLPRCIKFENQPPFKDALMPGTRHFQA